MQTRELREYSERRAWTLAGEYVDWMTGTKDRRPEGLTASWPTAPERKFDVVAAWMFDRSARSVSHLLRALETFKVLGIDFVSYSEQMDTSTPAGKMCFTVLGAVAELERSLIVERVKAGLRNAKAKGKSLLAAHDCGWRQDCPPALTGADSTRDCWRVRVFPQPCPQNPCEWRLIPRCKCSRLATLQFCP